MRKSIVKTAPAAEPITLTEAKTHLRILAADTTYDTEVTEFIKAARQWVENRYGIAIITQTRVQKQNGLCYDGDYNEFPLLYPPCQSITSFSYIKEDYTTGTLTENTHFRASGKITPTAGIEEIETTNLYPTDTWPTYKFIPNAISIEYVCGFGDSASYVPSPIKLAIKMKVAQMFEQRTGQTSGAGVAVVDFENTIDEIMCNYQNFQHVSIDA